jgi:hypothetical protein
MTFSTSHSGETSFTTSLYTTGSWAGCRLIVASVVVKLKALPPKCVLRRKVARPELAASATLTGVVVVTHTVQF